MEYDCRPCIKDEERVQWECKLVRPDGETVRLAFKNFALIPSEISLDNIGNSEAQLWGAFRWGLIEPKNWPVDSEIPGIRVFAGVPTQITLRIHNDWQNNSGVNLGELSASTTSSESEEKS